MKTLFSFIILLLSLISIVEAKDFFTEDTGKTIFINSFNGPVIPLDNEKYYITLTQKIRQAQKNILVCMYVFKISMNPKNLANKISNELISAAGKGVNVTVLLEENNRKEDKLNESNHNTAKKLQRAGIKVIFDEKSVNTHSKLIVIDKKFVFLGSHNLTHTALSKSNETSLLLDSVELAEYFTQYVHRIINLGK